MVLTGSESPIVVVLRYFFFLFSFSFRDSEIQ
jgi:hypothetical protein